MSRSVFPISSTRLLSKNKDCDRRYCSRCAAPFYAQRPWQKFCSYSCKQAARRSRKKEKGEDIPVFYTNIRLRS